MIHPTDTLVLMPCSARKHDMRCTFFELYTGPLWQTLRKYLGAIPFGNVCVLSAEYGLVNGLSTGGPYDRRLSREAASYAIERGVMARNTRFGRIKESKGCTGPSPWVETNCARRERPYTCVIQAGSNHYARVFEAYIHELQAYKTISAAAPILRTAGDGRGIGTQRSLLMYHLRHVNANVTPQPPHGPARSKTRDFDSRDSGSNPDAATTPLPYCPFCKKRHVGGDTCLGHHP